MRLPLRSWKDTLSTLGLKWGRKPQRRQRRSAQLSVEPLEARQLLAAYTWSGATGGSWGDITKWSGGAVPGFSDTATISGLNAGASITLDGGRQIGGLTIASNNSQTNVIAQGTGSGGLRVGTGGITTSGNQSKGISADIYLDGNQTWSISNTNGLTVSGAIHDYTTGPTLTKTGAQLLTFSGNNDFTGVITVSAGTVRAGHTNALGTTAGNTIVGGSGTLSLGASNIPEDVNMAGALTTFAASSLSGELNLNVSSANVPINTQSGTLTLIGKVTGTGGINKQGLGNLVLSNNTNDYTGDTVVNSSNSSTGILLGADNVVPGNVYVNTGFFDLNGHDETINKLESTSGVTTGIVTNSATGTWTLTVGADNSSSTFRGKLTNSSNKPLALKKTGTGALTLYNTANDYQGDTTVNGGTLKLGASNVIPNGSGKGNVIVGASGLFDLNGLSEAIGGLSGAGTVDSLAAGTVTLTVGDNNQTTQFTGTIDDTSGTLALTKTGTGTLRLDGSNTYAGATTVSAGTLGAGHANALGTTASDTAIGAAGTLSFGATGIAEVIVVQGALSTFAVSSVSGQLTLDVSSTNTIPINTQGGDLSLSGKVTGTGGLNKQGLENLILSSTANDYEGKTIINSGSTTSGIQLGASNVIPDGATAKDVLVNTGFLDLNGHNETIRGLDSTGSVTTGIVTNSAVGTWTLSVGAQDATSSFAGKITNTNGRPLALTKIGTGTLTIGNTNNDFQGDTTVNGGTLKLGAAEVIPHGATRGNVIVGATETLDLNGHSETINGLSGAGTVTNGVASAVTLTLGDNNQTSTFSGTITEVTSGPLSLTKIGTGSQRLDGANTYTGPTTINAGTLAINGSTVAASAVSVNNTGTLSGGLGAAAGSVGGTVTVAAGGRIAPGTITTTGILETGNATFASTSKYDVQLNGTTVGSGYDQLDVTGSVDLGSATVLVVSLGFTAVADDTFIIVNNDSADAVTGTFSGLAEGTVFAADGQLVQISYNGGDGNDVVLKRLGSPSISTSTSHDSDGQGNSQVNPLQRYTRPITVDMNTGGVIFHLDRGPDVVGADGIIPVYRQTFNAHPIVSLAYTLGSTVPTQLEAALSIGGIANAGSVFYDTAGLSPGQTIRLVLQADDVSELPSGHYEVKLDVTEHGGLGRTHEIIAATEIINRDASEFGVGWWVDGLDRIVTGEGGYYSSYDGGGDGVALIRGDGTAAWFAEDGAGGYTTPAGSFSTLVKNIGGDFTLTHPDGTTDEFLADGRLDKRTDRNDNVIDYTYDSGDGNSNGATDELTSIMDVFGLPTEYEYSGGYLDKVIDFAGRETDFQIGTTGDTTGYVNLIVEVDPDGPGMGNPLTSPETEFTYYVGSSYDGDKFQNLLETIKTPGIETDSGLERPLTTLFYGTAGRFTTASNADGTSWDLTAAQVSGLRSGSSGTPAAPVLPSDIKADYENELGNDWLYAVDQFGLMTSMTDPLSKQWTYQRDQNGLVTKLTEPAGAGGTANLGALVTAYTYDDRGNMLSATYADATSESWEYDEDFSQVTLHTDRRGYKTVSILDGDGNATEIGQQVDEGAAGYEAGGMTGWITTYFHYTTVSSDTPGGLVDIMTDPRGFETHTTYSTTSGESGLVASVTRAYGEAEASTQTFTYDAYRNSATATQVMATGNRTTMYAYDKLNRLTTITQPYTDDHAAPVTSYQYDPEGNRKQVTDARTNVTDFGFDLMARMTLSKQPSAGAHGRPETEYVYDYAGNLETVTDPLERTISYAYNDRNERVEEERPATSDHAESITTTTYDSVGNVETVEDALGRVTSFAYDTMHRKVEDILPSPGTGDHGATSTTYEYDENGNLTDIHAPLSRNTSYEYDGLNRRTKMTQPDPGDGPIETEYVYDDSGNMESVTDAEENTIEYAYDGLNRKIQMTQEATDDHGAPVTDYTYNEAGEMTEINDPLDRTTTILYDKLGRQIKVTQPTVATGTPITETHYDAVGNVTSRKDANKNVTSYQYDALNRQTLITAPQVGGSPTTTTLEYDIASQLLSREDSVHPKTEYAYDEQGRQISEIPPVIDGDSPVRFTHYDAVGNVTSIEEFVDLTYSKVTENEYDDLNRLIARRETDPEIDNVLFQTGEYHYDAAGRQVSTTDALDRTTTSQYDALDRLVSQTLPDVFGHVTDRGSAGYVETGTWTGQTDADANGGNQRYHAAGTGSNTATWTYSGLVIGRTYKIYVTYAADAINAATDSPYTVTHSGDSDPYTVDQQVAPDDYTSHGQVWHLLTSITIEDASDLVIELSDDVTSGRVLADAVALIDVDPTITKTYDKVGNTLTSTDAEGRTTTNVYDELYRAIQTTGPAPGVHPLTLSEPHAAPVTERQYDEVGNVLLTKDALERETTYVRDNLDRLIEVDLPGIDEDWRYGYDLVGNLLFETDPAGNTTHYYYDAQYRQTSVAAPLNDPLVSPFEETVDDDNDMDLSFVTAGSWAQEATGADDWYDNDYTWIAAGAGSNTATWMEDTFVAGKAYEVFVTWVADPSNATDAKFTVNDGVASEGDFVVDLTAAPAGEEVDGSIWQSLGIFSLTGAYMEVVLTDDADGRVTADAIRIVERGPVSRTTYDASGQVLTQVDSLGRVTSYEYDDLGRTIKVTSPDPDGGGPGQSPIQLTSYDHYGNVLSQTQVMGDEDSDPGRSLGDPDDLVTSFEYDNLFRRTKLIDANGDDTLYSYDLNGNLLSITDPVSNVTSYVYDEFDRQVLESVTVDSNVLTRSWEYDLMGNMLAKTDRQGRTMAYQYDNLDRQVAETWIDETGTPTNTVYSIYDIQGRLTDTEDDFSAYSYTYDDLDRVKTISNAGTPGVTEVILSAEYDDQNRRIELRAEIDGDDDFINTYAYNGRSQLTQILQDDQAENAVAYKRVEFDYDVADQLDQVRRYASSGNTHLVASTSYNYDGTGRLDGIVHAKGMTTLADYAWQFDEANRINQFVFSAVVDSIGTSTGTQTSDYSYDDRGQLVGADHDYQTDEDYTYDENGNRTTGIDSDIYSNATYSTGNHNRLESDGIYNYEYDAEGNRTGRTHIGSDAVTVYTWDVKNRLVKVTEYASTSDANMDTSPTQIVEYTYDMLNRRIGKAIDTDGDLDIDETARYVYDGDHIALQFEGTADADNAADLAHRYIFGQEIDQILADERVSSLLSDGDVLWALTDNLGSVRQLAEYDPGMTATTIQNYLEYDSFGNITREEAPAIDHAFGYTGRERDEETGMHFYRARYYDPVVGRFIGEDPIGFEAEDANLYRYVGNHPTNAVDPSGMEEPITSIFDLLPITPEIENPTPPIADWNPELEQHIPYTVEEPPHPDAEPPDPAKFSGNLWDNPTYEVMLYRHRYYLRYQAPRNAGVTYDSLALEAGSRIGVVVSIAFSPGVTSDGVAGTADWFNYALSNDGLTINPNTPDWKEASQFVTSLGNNSIRELVISGHGSPGSIASTITLPKLEDPDSPEFKFVASLKEKMVPTYGRVDIRVCHVAKGLHGERFIKKFASIIDADVTAIDDMYAVFPYGTEYTAHPDGSVTTTATRSAFKDSPKSRLIKDH